MQHAFERDVGDEMAVAGDEAAILANPAIGRDEAEGCGIGAHFASTTGSSACAPDAAYWRRADDRRRTAPPR